MLKTTLSALALTTTFNLGFAEQTAYSQNNLSQQNKQAHFLRKCPILFNADLLYGKINSQPLSALFVFNIDGTNTTNITPPVKNHAQLGLRVGLGIGLKNRFNFSGQYTYLRNKETNADSYPTPANPFVFFPPASYFNFPIFSNTPQTITADTKQILKWQQADLLLQTAAWMLTSNLRLQPFGGIRYTQVNANLNQIVGFSANLIGLPGLNFATENTHDKMRSLGPILGIDIKYLINNCLHFFSSINAGLLAGYRTVDTNFTIFSTTGNQFVLIFNTSDRTDLNWLPTLDCSFGLAQERKIGNRLLLSFRIAYEMHMVNNSYNPVFTSFATNPSQPPAFYYLMQVGSFGVTLAF